MIYRWAIAALWGMALLSASVSVSEAKSPIFGTASVSATTVAENKAVVGKGYYADYYGSYGIEFANYAAAYGNYGDYSDATNAAYEAYAYFNAAAYDQAAGY